MKLYLALFLMFFAFNANATLLDDANKAFDGKDYKEALSLYEKVHKEQPANKNVMYWASLSAKMIGSTDKQALYLEKLKSADGQNMGMQAREYLVQAYEKLGELSKRDEEIKEILELYKKNKDGLYKEKKFFVRDLFEVGDYKVIGFEYFDLIGEHAKKYHFFGQNQTTQLPLTVSLGSYEGINRYQREVGDIKDDQRVYHLDGYNGKKHYTYAFYNEEPDYNDIKEFAIKIYKESDPYNLAISSSNYNGGVFP